MFVPIVFSPGLHVSTPASASRAISSLDFRLAEDRITEFLEVPQMIRFGVAIEIETRLTIASAL
jgi:hypothetical protein